MKVVVNILWKLGINNGTYLDVLVWLDWPVSNDGMLLVSSTSSTCM